MGNKFFNKTSLTFVAVIFILCVVVYYSRQYEVDTLQSQLIHQTKIVNSLSPSPIKNKVIFTSEIPATTKYLTYRSNNYLFTRKLDNNILGKEIYIADIYRDQFISDVSPDGQFGAYLEYYSSQNSIYNDTMAGFGHQFILVNISTGDTLAVTSNLFGQAHISNFSFTPDSKQVFISLENNSLYFYNIASRTISQIFKPVVKAADLEFCSGYHLLDISPDKQNILMISRCFEGLDYRLLNLNTKKLTYLGGGYGGGETIVEKFINNNSLFAWTNEFQDDQYIDKYFEINLKGNKVTNLPSFTKAKSTMGYYTNGTQLFIAPLSYQKNPESIPLTDRQVIGNNVTELRLY